MQLVQHFRVKVAKQSRRDNTTQHNTTQHNNQATTKRDKHLLPTERTKRNILSDACWLSEKYQISIKNNASEEKLASFFSLLFLRLTTEWIYDKQPTLKDCLSVLQFIHSKTLSFSAILFSFFVFLCKNKNFLNYFK